MQKYSIKDFDRDFPDDNACLKSLFKSRWPNGVFCDKYGKVTKHYRIKNRPVYSRDLCGTQVYPMAGTIFHDTKFDHLHHWFKAIAYMAATRCGRSSRNLSRELGVTIKTGYRIWKQIRSTFAEGEGIKFIGHVEVDETYIGGKSRGKRGRGSENKTVVLGMVERKGRVKGIIIPNMKAKTLIQRIEAHLIKDAIVYTDNLPSYNGLTAHGFNHKAVAHSQKV